MQSKLLARAATGALIAAVTLSLGLVAAQAQVVNEAGAGEVNTENGVHAAPSGHVSVVRLDVIAGSGKSATGAKAAHLPSAHPQTTHLQTAHLQRAHVQRSHMQRAQLQQAHFQHAAPKGPASRRSVVQMAAQDRLTMQLPEAPASRSVDVAETSGAAIGPYAGPEPAPRTTLVELARADVPLRAALQVPALAVPPELASLPAPDPEVIEQASEEAAVYGRPVQEARADTDAGPASEPQASLLLVRNDRPRPAPSKADSDGGIRQHVAFPRRSAEAAAAFDRYMHAAAGIDAGFKSGSGVAAALKTAAAYDPLQLEEGMVAYGALAALQSQRFVYAVMDVAANSDDRRAMIDTLLANPEAAVRLHGADEAAGLAGAAILHEARPVVATGRSLKQAAYDVQHQGWSTLKASDQSGRLAQAKSASSGRAAPAEGDMARLVSQVSTGAAQGDENAGSRMSPVTARSLALAALAILDGAGGGEDGRLTPVISETISADCLRLAKLNLFQCLSVAGPEYEDVYCLGQHAVLDTGQCVAGAAGAMDVAMASQGPRMSRPEELK